MLKTGTVISVSLSTQVKKQAGGTYEAWELVYKNADGQIESIQKPVQGLKFNPSLKDSLASLSTGDAVTISLEKNAGNFWEVKTITKGIVEVSNEPKSAAAGVNKVTGSNYETPAERANRQTLIVRQSCLAQAVATATIHGAKVANVVDILKVADQYVNWVNSKGEDNGVV
jgi:hypothetical protein